MIDPLNETAAGGDSTGDALALIENLIGSAFGDTLTGDGGVNTLDGGAGNDALFGGGSADNPIGGGGNDTLAGDSDQDRMSGGIGKDLYSVDAAGDAIFEAAAEGTAERVLTSVSYALAAGLTAMNPTDINMAQAIAGNAGINVLNRSGGDDILVGLAGADTLNGGSGADQMDGGASNDWYFVDQAGAVHDRQCRSERAERAG